jgi:hypothetical protein
MWLLAKFSDYPLIRSCEFPAKSTVSQSALMTENDQKMQIVC